MNPPPAWSKGKGCRPVIEVYSTHHYPKKLLYTTLEHPTNSVWYNKADGPISWEMNCVVQSDILIAFSKYKGAKKKAKKMFRYSFHCGFVKPGITTLKMKDFDDTKKFVKWFDDPNAFEVRLTFAEPPSKLAKIESQNLKYDDEIAEYFNEINEVPENLSKEELEAIKVRRRRTEMPFASKKDKDDSQKKTPNEIKEETQPSSALPEKGSSSPPETRPQSVSLPQRRNFLGSSRSFSMQEVQYSNQKELENENNLLEQAKQLPKEVNSPNTERKTKDSNILKEETKEIPKPESKEKKKEEEKEKKIEKEPVEIENLDDEQFMEDFLKVLETREDEKRRMIEAMQFQQQQDMLRKKSLAREEPPQPPKISIGKFGML